MPEPVHLLVVRAAGLMWALPMASVEQTFDLRSHSARRVGTAEVVRFRGQVLELVNVAERLGLTSDQEPSAAVVVWASGRRRAFAVEELVGQLVIDKLEIPSLATGDMASGVVLHGDEVVPILEPGAITGDWQVATQGSVAFTEMQQSALREIANIGAGHAATAFRPTSIR